MHTQQFPSSSITISICHLWLYNLLTLMASGKCSIAFWIESSCPPNGKDQLAMILKGTHEGHIYKTINISHTNKTATFKADGREWEVEFDKLCIVEDHSSDGCNCKNVNWHFIIPWFLIWFYYQHLATWIRAFLLIYLHQTECTFASYTASVILTGIDLHVTHIFASIFNNFLYGSVRR